MTNRSYQTSGNPGNATPIILGGKKQETWYGKPAYLMKTNQNGP